ncbi:MAG: PASTA domain-containing protein, partial [Pseudonocardia sp.]|nr:PASTA domain-containing protein [Pseudonocardia sp.]
DHVRARRRSRHLFGAGIALVVVLALLVAATAWWLGTGRWTEVPTLLGVQQATAEQLLAESDLVQGAVTSAFDDAAPAGVVTGVDPAPGARLLRGATVTLTVSSGRPVVPAIEPGTAVAAAEDAVRAAGLTPVRNSSAAEFSDTVPAGAVIGTDPGAGTEVEIDGAVTLVVSRGVEPPPEPEEVRVPRVLGRDVSSATEILSDAGLEVEERNRLPFLGRDDPTVVGQTPGAGTLVEEGTTIVLDSL